MSLGVVLVCLRIPTLTERAQSEREREKTTHTNYPTDSNLNEQKQKQETKKKKLNRQILFEKKKHNNEEPNERIM